MVEETKIKVNETIIVTLHLKIKIYLLNNVENIVVFILESF